MEIREVMRRLGDTGKWNADRTQQVYRLALMGSTDEEIAAVLLININTLNLWKRVHPEFLAARNRGRDAADAYVAEALYKRATGFWVDVKEPIVHKGEVTGYITRRKYYPPDSWAAARWLSLRHRDKWSEVIRTENTQTNINITKIDLKALNVDELKLLDKMGMRQLMESTGEN